MASDCLFCAIVAGETPGAVVLEDDDFVGFLDIRPVFKGHVLLVPRAHVVTLPDLPAALRDGFLAHAQRLATAMVEGLGAQGSFVALNNTVSQSVAHLHLHVVPAHEGRRAARLLLAAHQVRRRRRAGRVRRPGADGAGLTSAQPRPKRSKCTWPRGSPSSRRLPSTASVIGGGPQT